METIPGYYSGINILGAGVEVTKVTFCASFCCKSLSQPFLCNLDSTPPQVINAAANDGEPGVGGQSPTSQDGAPIQDGLPEISARFCNRPDFTSAKKARADPNFYLGLQGGSGSSQDWLALALYHGLEGGTGQEGSESSAMGLSCL